LIWTLLVTGALAVDGDDELAKRLLAIREGARDTVLVAASGAEAERTVVRVLKPAGEADFELTRIPTVGDLDRESWAALERAGLKCGARVALGADEAWSITPFGDCAPPTGAATVDGPAVHTRAPGAVSARSPEQWAQIDQRYNQRRLEVDEVTHRMGLPEGIDWRVLDGRGVPVTARRLADLAGDSDLTLRLDQEQRDSFKRSRWISWTGVALLVAAPLPLLGVESGAVQSNQDRLFSALFLAGAGGVTIAVAPQTRKGALARQQHPAWYYDEEDGDDVIVDYNRRLYAELGLDERPREAPPQAVEISASAPAPDADSSAPGAGAVVLPDDPTQAPAEGAAVEPAQAPAEEAAVETTPGAVVLPDAPAPEPEPEPDVVVPSPVDPAAEAPPLPTVGADADGRAPSDQ
jgi:hypothetical protein